MNLAERIRFIEQGDIEGWTQGWGTVMLDPWATPKFSPRVTEEPVLTQVVSWSIEWQAEQLHDIKLLRDLWLSLLGAVEVIRRACRKPFPLVMSKLQKSGLWLPDGIGSLVGHDESLDEGELRTGADIESGKILLCIEAWRLADIVFGGSPNGAAPFDNPDWIQGNLGRFTAGNDINTLKNNSYLTYLGGSSEPEIEAHVTGHASLLDLVSDLVEPKVAYARMRASMPYALQQAFSALSLCEVEEDRSPVDCLVAMAQSQRLPDASDIAFPNKP